MKNMARHKVWMAVVGGIALLGLTAVPTTAAIITPTIAESTTFIGSGGRDIGSTIDSSGLDGSGDILTQRHLYAYEDTNDHYWLSESGAGTTGAEVLTFTLDSAYDVDALHIWQYGIKNDDRRQIHTATLTFSSNGVDYGNPVVLNYDRTAYNDAAGIPVESRTFTSVPGVTHVKMLVENSGGGSDYIGLSEIRLGGGTGIPEPSTLALVGLGLFSVFFRRPRRK